jgi:hypothetical protein
MRLIGSRIENELRAEILASRAALSDGRNKGLRDALEASEIDIRLVAVVNWIPEQGEDIYHVLLPSDEILIIEVPHEGLKTLEERIAVREYASECSKVARLKLAVAKDVLVSSSP